MASVTRRDVLRLGAAGLGCSIAGCLSGGTGEPTETSTPTPSATETPTDTATAVETPTDTATAVETPTDTATTTRTPTRNPAGPGDCEWPSMCEGTRIVQVRVASGFSGAVVLQADCRTEEFPVESGKSTTISREADGEECSITLTVDGAQAHSETIEGHERVTLTVTRKGEIEAERTVL